MKKGYKTAQTTALHEHYSRIEKVRSDPHYSVGHWLSGNIGHISQVMIIVTWADSTKNLSRLI